jgi:A/G-specific adenine glycosylase
MARLNARAQVREQAALPLTDAQIESVRRRLLRWGKAHFRSFPWRTETDPWLSFVAEFLLQRTRAAQVEEVFVDLRARLPTASSLVAAGEPAIRQLTGRLGLHWRGPLLLRIAETVAAAGGRPPERLDDLRALTGVGMYTAAAWLSLHRGHRAAIVDANVARWLSRMTGLPYNRDPRHVRWVKDLAERLTPARAYRAFNYAVLDFTMIVCLPRRPCCGRCPLRSDCRYGRSAESRPGGARAGTRRLQVPEHVRT